MTGLPRRLLKDAASVQTYQGEGAAGPVLATAVTVYGKATLARELVRTADGSEAVSDLTFYCDPDDAAAFAPESLVTVAGHVGRVISVSTHSRPGQAVLTKVRCS